ncbi:hypothetical protein J7J90_04775 [Candidatus Micrarchaeota archaeon]|nr:hypothetical protein [Candidatus Micrarchaeota archaeon]
MDKEILIKSINENYSKYQEYNELFEQAITLYNNITQYIFISTKNKGKKLENVEALFHIYLSKSKFYFEGSRLLVLANLNNPSLALMRNIYESILLEYYIHAFPEKGKEIYLDIINKTHNHKLTKPSKIREALYTPAKEKQINKVYESLCEQAHPNITGLFSDFEDHERFNETKEERFKLLLGLLNAEFIVMVEHYYDILTDKQKKDVDDLLTKIAIKLGSIVDLVPDKPEIKGKLKLTMDKIIQKINECYLFPLTFELYHFFIYPY